MRHELCCGDNRLWLNQLRDDPIEMIFADPVDNIGLGYKEYKDNLPVDEYIKLLKEWMYLFVSKASTTWISSSSKQ